MLYSFAPSLYSDRTITEAYRLGDLQYLASYFAAANRYNYAGTLVWAAYGNVPETAFLLSLGNESYPGYNFEYSQVRKQARKS